MNWKEHALNIIENLKSQDPWVFDMEEGSYCFYCGCEYKLSLQGEIFQHRVDCVYLMIEEIPEEYN